MAERIAVMNFGVLQQVGAFEEIYNHPVNEFVAGFIGEPPMNLLACTPVSEGDAVYLAAADGGFRLRLPDTVRARLTATMPAKVDLGIRPVHLDVVSTPDAGGQLEVTGTVHTYEDLGEEGQLAVKVGNCDLLVVTAPRLRLPRGQNVTLRMRADRIHLFNAETKYAL